MTLPSSLNHGDRPAAVPPMDAASWMLAPPPGSDFADTVRTLLRRKGLIAGCLFGAVALCIALGALLPQRYSATTQVMIGVPATNLGDIRAVVRELIESDRLPEIFAAGFSMGGNLVLKMAGELGDVAPPELRGFVCVAPAFDLARCADALAESRNVLYEGHFVRSLKRRMRHKARLFPERYAAAALNGGMRGIRTVRDFDDVITAPFCGFRDADDYYARSSAVRVVAAIRRPTLIVAAQDDPFVPFSTIERAEVRKNPSIRLIAPRFGGHCGFISQESGEERFWCEARIVEFCREHSSVIPAQG